jgi:DnaJ-class molecular chaperone
MEKAYSGLKVGESFLGINPDQRIEECKQCNGTGEVHDLSHSILTFAPIYKTCDTCHGSGIVGVDLVWIEMGINGD